MLDPGVLKKDPAAFHTVYVMEAAKRIVMGIDSLL